MSRRFFLIALIVSVGLGVFAWSGAPVLAAQCTDGRDTGVILPACTCDGSCTVNDFVAMFINLATFFLGIVGLLAIFYFIVGAYDWVLAGGRSEMIKSGKTKITNAVIGLVIVLVAWAAINTIYYILIGSDTVFGGKWFELKSIESPAAPTQPVNTQSGSCDNLQALAMENNNALYPADNAPILDQLITCIQNNVPPSMIDENQIYTVDRDHPTCNYTRGRPLCDTVCSHAVNSCHYGGSTGTQGAMGVDFNAQAGTSEAALAAKIREAGAGPCAAFIKSINPKNETDHTHISARGCDSN